MSENELSWQENAPEQSDVDFSGDAWVPSGADALGALKGATLGVTGFDGHKAFDGINSSVSEIDDLADWPSMVMAIDAIIEKSNQAHAKIQEFEDAGGNVFADPLGMLAGTLVNFVLELCQPLQDLLGLVTGNHTRMKTCVEMWLTVVRGGMETGAHIAETGAEVMKDWSGDDGEAARHRVAEIGQAVTLMSMWGIAIAVALRGMAWIALKCEMKVKKILSDIVEEALTKWLPGMASGAATFGASSAATVTLAVVQIANWIITAYNFIQMAITLCELVWEVFQSIGDMMPSIDEVLNFFKK
ncbi:hypothetical protein [Glycomyces xiaoerkulensis]|uniref:hypothetical protein n=1 Tax=Glycomyces xiaoerkulensis TaxID=2038139 RepID=UPI000C25D8D7|nr:hypothetical protein [Glycomyces xiaoerkulensis]